MSIYAVLTRQFNDGRIRAVLSGGQAVVLHRLAIMSKDGDWILREDEEALHRVLSVLSQYQARYRFGAPLDLRWMQGGWSSHFEFSFEGIRVRADFVTRPPRLDAIAIQRLWMDQETSPRQPAFVGARDLVEMKKTNREKDYAVIGELARLMTDVDDTLLTSRSARDLIRLAGEHPERARTLAARRRLLGAVSAGSAAVEAALDAERRELIHANEARLERYLQAAERWRTAWPTVAGSLTGQPLEEAHRIITREAVAQLPFTVPGGWP